MFPSFTGESHVLDCRLPRTDGWNRPAWILPGLLAAALLLSFGGCGSSGRPMPLDKQLAKDSFNVFLESWKRGEQQTALKDKSPSIIANDPDWAAGAKLKSYKPVNLEKDDGSNLHPTVELVLQTKQGEQTTQVTYVVGTSPVITVFREN
jgi:hypothetical protein